MWKRSGFITGANLSQLWRKRSQVTINTPDWKNVVRKKYKPSRIWAYAMKTWIISVINIQGFFLAGFYQVIADLVKSLSACERFLNACK